LVRLVHLCWFFGSFGSSLLVFWCVWFIFVGFLVRLVHLCWFFGSIWKKKEEEQTFVHEKSKSIEINVRENLKSNPKTCARLGTQNT
jgi:hypothetical protein